MRIANRRIGLTIVELLVSIAIIGLLVALLLPAVQSAREAARRISCQNNLKQVGIAVELFEAAYKYLPSAAYGRPYEYIPNGRRPTGNIIASTFTDLLPYIEQTSIAIQYQWDKDWFDESNQPVVNTSISIYRCPSSVGSGIQRGIGSGGGYSATGTAATTDYSSVYSWGFPMAIPASPPSYDIWGVSALSPALEGGGFAQPKRIQTTDGASQTLTFVEQSDQGRRWVRRKLINANPSNAGAWAPWAGESCTWLLSYVADGSTWSSTGLGPGNVNVNNSQGIYSFHPDGANVVFLDGRVHFLVPAIEPKILYALVTRSRGEVVELFQ
jgi:prepilin-type processing-associated H-X9-DG protein